MNVLSDFILWLRRRPMLIAVAALGFIVAATLLFRGDGNAAYVQSQKDEDERVRLAMNAAAATRTASTPSVREVPTPTPISDQEKLERDTAAGLALKVVEPVDKILELTDTAIGSIDRLDGPRKITRMEFLFLAANVIDGAEKDPKLRKRVSVDKNGKFTFDQVASAALLLGFSTIASSK